MSWVWGNQISVPHAKTSLEHKKNIRFFLAKDTQVFDFKQLNIE